MKQEIPQQYFHRRSIRLPGYDYSEEGSYFVTLVTHQRTHLFGTVVDEKVRLNEFGKIVEEEWIMSASIRKEITIEQDEFVVMPNHFHGIVTIEYPDDGVRAYGHTPLPEPSLGLRSPSRTLGSMIRGFKSAVTKRINALRGTPSAPVWLRNYYEHIIMNDEEYATIWEYIRFNPINWNINDEYR